MILLLKIIISKKRDGGDKKGIAGIGIKTGYKGIEKGIKSDRDRKRDRDRNGIKRDRDRKKDKRGMRVPSIFLYGSEFSIPIALGLSLLSLSLLEAWVTQYTEYP